MASLMSATKASEQCHAFVAKSTTGWPRFRTKTTTSFERSKMPSCLADDEAVIDSDKSYGFHSLPLDQIHCTTHRSCWRPRILALSDGPKLLRTTRHAYTGKLNIQRIFAVTEPLTDPACRVITSHAQAGIIIKVACEKTSTMPCGTSSTRVVMTDANDKMANTDLSFRENRSSESKTYVEFANHDAHLFTMDSLARLEVC
jgi:hypothetical protein